MRPSEVEPLDDLDRFDPLAESYNADPSKVLARARESAPVFYASGFGVWVISRREDVEAALTDWQTFSNVTLADAPVPAELHDRVPPGFFSRSFNAVDPPAHTPVRKCGQKGFTRNRVAAMPETIAGIAEEIVTELSPRGGCDLIGDFCHELSHRTIMHLLRLPAEDLPRMRQLAEDLPRVFTDHLAPMDPAERTERWERVAELREYFKAVAAERRRDSPEGDWVGDLARAEDETGAPLLSDERIATHMTELIFAGTDTTANLIAQAVILLSEHPDQRELLREDPGLIEGTVEEVLRHRGTVNGVFRRVTQDVQVAGVEIPAGATAYLALSSANHDDSGFARPEEFDIRRGLPSKHLAFGKGRHLCMGAPLARAETATALQVLYARLPTLRVVEPIDLEFEPVLLSVMLKELPVEW